MKLFREQIKKLVSSHYGLKIANEDWTGTNKQLNLETVISFKEHLVKD